MGLRHGKGSSLPRVLNHLAVLVRNYDCGRIPCLRANYMHCPVIQLPVSAFRRATPLAFHVPVRSRHVHLGRA